VRIQWGMLKTSGALPHPVVFGILGSLTCSAIVFAPAAFFGGRAILREITAPTPAPVEAPPAAQEDKVAAKAAQIAADIEARTTEVPGRTHVLTTLGQGGSMQILFTIPAGAEWTQALREELTDTIAAAIEQGAIQFQLIAIAGVPGTVVER
jgi:hypothetical protein